MSRVRIATYNVHSGVGIDRRFRPERILAVIADPRPLSWAMLVFAAILLVAVALLLRAFRRRTQARKAEARA